MSYFLEKTTKKCIFGLILKNPRKTQGPFENPGKNPRPSEKTQEPKIASKNPRSWEKTQAVATLVFSVRSSVATLKKSKTLDGPLKKTQKTPGEISMRFAYILGKHPTFSEKVALLRQNF